MVPSPSLPFTWDYWTTSPPDVVELTCLIPNSLCITLEAKRDATLHDVKEDIWEKADNYPLRGMLHDMSHYVFQFINSLAVLEEVDDESKRLRDVKPVCGVLRLIKRPGDKAGDKLLNTHISNLLGMGLNEFDTLNSPEVNDFRMNMRIFAEEKMRCKMQMSKLEQLKYRYPPRLADTPGLPSTIKTITKNFVLVTKFEKLETSFTFNVSYTITPHQLLKIILNKKANTLNTRGEQPDDFVLKVCGREEYLVGDHPLIQFLYIQETLAREAVPTVVTICLDNLPFERLKNAVFMEPPQRNPYPTSTIRKKTKTVSSYDIRDNFTVTIDSIDKLNIDTSSGSVEVGIQAGLFHGGKSLCECKKTLETVVSSDGTASWQEKLTFDIKVENLPRMTRLCFVIYEVSKTSRSLKSRKVKDSNKDLYMNPVGWVNTMVFSYQRLLKRGAETLYAWPHVDDTVATDHLLQPLATVLANPYDHCARLTIRYHDYNKQQTIVYPSLEEIITFAEHHGELENSMNRLSVDNMSTDDIEQLKRMVERDPIYELHEQERNMVWALREHFRTSSPALLGKLLQCVEWGERREAAHAVLLLKRWPQLPVQRALELLDYAYPDPYVRAYAVACLQHLSNEELSLYLLQLVQALKHESYLACDLVYFLLDRALSNMTIGHYFFWHLKSEMHVPSTSVRFGLILEAYCRGCQEHLSGLLRQITFFQKLRGTSEMVRQRKDIEKARSFLIEYLKEPHCKEALSNVTSPLDPSFICKQIKPEKCRVMDSKMRPLGLVFENLDNFGSDICIIFKNGDDLRQDMFTLQMLRIMDKLWKANGYDFRMNLYNCISMDNRVGMIEVVVNAETIAKIQKERVIISATSAFKKGSLLSWLKEHNTTEEALDNAIKEFTWSCAGYCVATYVLGIADRHSDNIMITRTGQLFHIDFGHILGHFKEKFGVRRERVPFVLTHDFVHVITKGQKDATKKDVHITTKGQKDKSEKKEALEFQLFQHYCEEAFLILRRNGELFLSLCAMMISTGLPELSSEKDLQYLRETLVMDLPEDKAREHFRSKFNEALRNSWKTSINWALHNNAKNNKQ